MRTSGLALLVTLGALAGCAGGDPALEPSPALQDFAGIRLDCQGDPPCPFTVEGQAEAVAVVLAADGTGGWLLSVEERNPRTADVGLLPDYANQAKAGARLFRLRADPWSADLVPLPADQPSATTTVAHRILDTLALKEGTFLVLLETETMDAAASPGSRQRATRLLASGDGGTSWTDVPLPLEASSGDDPASSQDIRFLPPAFGGSPAILLTDGVPVVATPETGDIRDGRWRVATVTSEYEQECQSPSAGPFGGETMVACARLTWQRLSPGVRVAHFSAIDLFSFAGERLIPAATVEIDHSCPDTFSSPARGRLFVIVSECNSDAAVAFRFGPDLDDVETVPLGLFLDRDNTTSVRILDAAADPWGGLHLLLAEGPRSSFLVGEPGMVAEPSHRGIRHLVLDADDLTVVADIDHGEVPTLGGFAGFYAGVPSHESRRAFWFGEDRGLVAWGLGPDAHVQAFTPIFA